MPSSPTFLPLFLLFFTVSNAYIFECLDSCECDTTDYIIYCGGGSRTQLELPPEGRLRGFSTIGLIDNNLINLPVESDILEKFPDLEIIEVERNPSFNCSSIPDFKKIKIVSDCDKNLTDISKLDGLPGGFNQNQTCGLSCQTSKHYNKFRTYAMSLWTTIVEKYENFDLNETVTAIANFFSKLMKKINFLEKKEQEEESERISTPEMATPMTMLKETNIGEEVEISNKE